jgi:hypothetical protein
MSPRLPTLSLASISVISPVSVIGVFRGTTKRLSAAPIRLSLALHRWRGRVLGLEPKSVKHGEGERLSPYNPSGPPLPVEAPPPPQPPHPPQHRWTAQPPWPRVLLLASCKPGRCAPAFSLSKT